MNADRTENVAPVHRLSVDPQPSPGNDPPIVPEGEAVAAIAQLIFVALQHQQAAQGDRQRQIPPAQQSIRDLSSREARLRAGELTRPHDQKKHSRPSCAQRKQSHR